MFEAVIIMCDFSDVIVKFVLVQIWISEVIWHENVLCAVFMSSVPSDNKLMYIQYGKGGGVIGSVV